ncbi:MAG: peptidylprolyl isomerase [Holophagales bacterium]|jgi:parvulin-like peptidyl-prolyl isomerase|nr:peptidylprolyl isomerase [Holophagales bacterium]
MALSALSVLSAQTTATGKKQTPPPAASKKAPAATPKLAPAPAPKPTIPENPVIAHIGDNVYRQSDVFEYWSMFAQKAQIDQMRSNPAVFQQAQASFLETMLLLNKAKKDGLDKTQGFRDKANRATTNLTNSLLAKEYVELRTPELDRLSTPSDEQMVEYYEEHQGEYQTQPVASARHILVAVQSEENPNGKLSDADALAKITKVAQELAAGKSWQDAAKEYSEDPGSVDKGGLYENFNPAQMVPEFAEAVQTQEIGKIGKPIKTRFGYHIIMVESRQPARAQTFDEAKAAIKTKLQEKMRLETWNNFVSNIKNELGYAEGADAAKATGGAK